MAKAAAGFRVFGKKGSSHKKEDSHFSRPDEYIGNPQKIIPIIDSMEVLRVEDLISIMRNPGSSKGLMDAFESYIKSVKSV